VLSVSPIAQRLCDLVAGHCSEIVLDHTPVCSSRPNRPVGSAPATVVATVLGGAPVAGASEAGKRFVGVSLGAAMSGCRSSGVMVVASEEASENELAATLVV
jgi:hypothetical protein